MVTMDPNWDQRVAILDYSSYLMTYIMYSSSSRDLLLLAQLEHQLTYPFFYDDESLNLALTGKF